MLKALPRYEPETADREWLELINWIWNSHYWVEFYAGYYRCSWCSMNTTSTIGVTREFPLCQENPAIRDLKERLITSTEGRQS